MGLLTRHRFITHPDTPSSFSGQTGLFTRVNPGEDALEFAAPAGGFGQAFPLQEPAGGTAWFKPGWNTDVMAGGGIQADRLFLMPIWNERSHTFVRIGVNVTTAIAGSVLRLGIYNAGFNASGQMFADTLVVDAGTVSAATTGNKEIIINQTLAAGWYYLAFSSAHAPSLNGPSTRLSVNLSPAFDTQTAANRYVPVAVVADGAAALPDPATVTTLFQTIAFGMAFLRM